ncbi:hypothetical protein SAMN04488072_109163 [Lentibacillus halodurans]|uniref:Uncharacterized protein n=1 Tax=Lentibacillus halodurans TaxID=237679 RepID=A0A1I0Z5V8_9BACI|nr:hypothetical protein [Lentibacillus halodurans]SFB20486.1 hypothetical protein SAMN04488072_109163 [Lentibacillus halodurans]
MIGFLCFLIVLLIIGGIRLYEYTQKKNQGYLLKIFSKVSYIEGFDQKAEVTIKVYADKITFNDTATIPMDKINKVSSVHQFVRAERGKRYFSQPYFHDIEIYFNSIDGYKKSIRLERIGKISNQFLILRETIHKLTGIEGRHDSPPSKPFNL